MLRDTIEKREKRVLGRISRHEGCGDRSQRRGRIGRQAEMGECPEFGCEPRLPRQPDDEIRAPPGIMGRGADLARAQGRDGGLGQRFDGARLVGLPVNHQEACGPQGPSRLLLVVARRHMENCEAGPQISANQPRQGNGITIRNDTGRLCAVVTQTQMILPA